MAIITTYTVVDLNKLLEKESLSFKIHMSDACGKQSFRIESLNDDFLEIESLKTLIETFLKEKRIEIDFSDDNKRFWSK